MVQSGRLAHAFDGGQIRAQPTSLSPDAMIASAISKMAFSLRPSHRIGFQLFHPIAGVNPRPLSSPRLDSERKNMVLRCLAFARRLSQRLLFVADLRARPDARSLNVRSASGEAAFADMIVKYAQRMRLLRRLT